MVNSASECRPSPAGAIISRSQIGFIDTIFVVVFAATYYLALYWR
jgi:hypothetical protein